ncbi:MAG TPA: hypothetical protein VKZ97_00270 [Flavobacteriaceae bacterium]|nr:hypothetical protein [Flavobacteriaceae bacterium]
MTKYLVFVGLFLTFFSCKEEKQEPSTSNETKVYNMYKPSEMALLMNQMYEYNLNLKHAILNGETPTEFPLDFLKIHSAEMTKSFERDETFKSFAKLFIETNKQVYNTDSEMPIEERFNNVVNLCISCHQTSCTGPIPRIKKLLIQE